MSKYHECPRFSPKIVLQILLILLWSSAGFGAKGIELDRIRLVPKLSIAEEYSDNVFLSEKDEEDEYITTISPKLSLDFALAPRNILSLGYEGYFRFYTEFDNLDKDRHLGRLSWTSTTSNGSSFELGANVEDSSIQPFSEEDRRKDFVTRDAFADILLKLGAFTELGLGYDRTSRRFDSPLDEIDEFDRDTVSLDFVYKYLPYLPLLLEYRYSHQDNKDPGMPSTDMDTHTVFVGARWDPTAKLSGTLRVGYTQTDFEEVGDFSGLATDTELTYLFSDITTFKLSASRMVVRSTRAARETGNYYISTGGRLAAIYNKWEPLVITLDFTYRNNDYEEQDSLDEDREDNYFGAGLRAEYFLREGLSFSLGYQYRRNDSNFATVDYKENRVEAGFSLSI